MGGRKKNNKYEVKAWKHAPNSKSSHFVRLYGSMLNSPAWLALSNGAKLQYIVINIKAVISRPTAMVMQW